MPALLALALLAPPARAQGIVSARVMQSTASGVLARCQPPGSGFVPGSIAYVSCDGATWGGPFEASASARGGVLRNVSSVAAAGYNPGQVDNLTTSAYAGWSEQALVTGAGAAHLELTMRLTGRTGVNLTGARGFAVAYAVAAFNGEPLYESRQAAPASCAAPGAPCEFVDAFDQTFTRRVAVGGGSATFAAAMRTEAVMGADRNGPVSGYAAADLGNALHFLSYRVLDAGSADITGAVQVTFVQGTQFGPGTPGTTVPEPRTWALVGSGMLALAAARRPRRRG